MADTKISALAAVVTVATTDEFAVNQGGTSKKMTLAQILAGTVAGGPVPVGGIILWSGTIATIPTNWALCDGSANSPGPDLRDKFIAGAKQDDAGTAKTNLTGSLTASGAAAVSAHTLSTNVAIDAHSGTAVDAHALSTNVAIADHTLTTNVALSAHSLSTNVAIADHTLTTSAGRTSTASTRAFVTTSGALTHTITQPVVQAHSITQPVVSAHTITQPVVQAHSITQPTTHAVTQPVVSAHTSVWPAYYALAYIQRMA